MQTVADLIPLTSREQICLQRCAEGKLDTEIAAEFAISTSEVTLVFSMVLSKLRCPNRLVAIVKAARLGLLSLKAAPT